MSEFYTFYKLGLEHILDKNGYDHIVFVIALCALYQAEDWKKVLILVTAFTVGHSVTLALSTLSVVNIDSDLVEFLIPVTIFITAIANVFTKTSKNQVSTRNYVFAGFFGLIHGLGFSNYLKSLLGRDQSILTQLFAFNIGLEVGQIIIVTAFLAVGFLVVSVFGASQRDWKFIVSSMVAGIALALMLNSSYLF